MIQLTPQMRLLLAVEPVDFRKGIDGLAQVCRQRLQVDPLAGALFIFSNRRRRAIKILVYDGYRNTEIMGQRLVLWRYSQAKQRFGDASCSHNQSASKKAKTLELAFFGARPELGACR